MKYREYIVRYYASHDDIPAGHQDGEIVAELVRCEYCKHRIVNKNAGKKGYLKLKAMCEYDSGDIFALGKCAEDDEWFCADAEREEE